MTTKEQAKKILDSIPLEDREKETAKRFKESKERLNEANKEYKEQEKKVLECQSLLLSKASKKHKAQAQQAINHVNKLIRELRKGGNHLDTIKKLNDLRL